MPSSFSHENRLRTQERVRLYRFDADWPLEVVEAEVEVTTPRELNAFEWVLTSIIEAFADTEVSLEEAATQLSLGDPVLLRDSLRSLEEVRAIERAEPANDLNLRHAQLTTTGSQLLREGHLPGLIERHGVHLVLDVLTGEHFAKRPRKARRKAEKPLLKPDDLPQRIQHIGLDRIRDLCNRQNEPYHKGESRIVGVNVHVEQGHSLWEPAELSLELNKEGTVFLGITGSEDRQAWLNEQGWSLDAFRQLDRLATRSWANGRCMIRMPAVSAESWMKMAERPIAPVAVLNEAVDLIRSAKQEVVAHTGWLDGPGIAEALTQGAQRGIRCVVCGAELSVKHWTASDGQLPGFVASAGSPDEPRPLAIVVDRSRALSVNHLHARTPSGQELLIEVAALVKKHAVSSFRDELLNGIPGELGQEHHRRLFAAFAITGDPGFWHQGIQSLERQTTALERIAELCRWGEWAEQLAPDNPPQGGWLARGEKAWWAALDAALQGANGEYTALIEVAPRSLPPGEVLRRLLEGIRPALADQDIQLLCELVMRTSDVQRRWPDAQDLIRSPMFTRPTRACFDSDQEDYREAIRRALDMLAAARRFRTHSQPYLQVLSAAIPRPQDLPGFLDWLDAHTLIRQYLGETFESAARSQLQRFKAELNKANRHNHSSRTRLRELWDKLGLPKSDLQDIIPTENHRPSTSKTNPKQRRKS